MIKLLHLWRFFVQPSADPFVGGGDLRKSRRRRGPEEGSVRLHLHGPEPRRVLQQKREARRRLPLSCRLVLLTPVGALRCPGHCVHYTAAPTVLLTSIPIWSVPTNGPSTGRCVVGPIPPEVEWESSWSQSPRVSRFFHSYFVQWSYYVGVFSYRRRREGGCMRCSETVGRTPPGRRR